MSRESKKADCGQHLFIENANQEHECISGQKTVPHTRYSEFAKEHVYRVRSEHERSVFAHHFKPQIFSAQRHV